MKGSAVNARQKRYHDLVATHVGCLACLKDTGHRNTHISIHHCDGRTKPWAHWFVLGLCAGHHQDGYGEPGQIAIHPYKARFEERYGRQIELVHATANHLEQMGFEVPVEVLELVGDRM